MFFGGAPTRRFEQRQVQREKRSERVVPKALRFVAHVRRDRVPIKQLQKSLLGIKSGGNKGPRGDSLPAGQGNPHRLSVAAQDALQFDSGGNFSAMPADVLHQCLSERGRSAATHLRETASGQ